MLHKSEKEERKYYAKIFRELLDEKDITQKYMSDLIGIPSKRLNKFLHATAFPHWDEFVVIAEFFGRDPQQMWDEVFDYGLRHTEYDNSNAIAREIRAYYKENLCEKKN